MSRISAQLLRLLTQAAELKARGSSWDHVAAQVGRRPSTCRRWTTLYPAAWRRLFGEAQRRLVTDAGAEGVQALRSQLRSEDEKVRRDAARTLVGMLAQLHKADDGPADPADDAGRLREFLEGLDDARVTALDEELRPTAPDGDAGPVADGGVAESD
jgi:hypothetical protein